MRLLSTREAADLLGIQPGTLKLWRHQGKGPPFIKKGHAAQAGVGYELSAVEAWKADRTYASTSAVTVEARSTRIHSVSTPQRASA